MPKNYAAFQDVRVFANNTTGKLELTIKDPRLPDGFKLTLNSGRKEELALRKILEEDLDSAIARSTEDLLPVYLEFPDNVVYSDKANLMGYSQLMQPQLDAAFARSEFIPMGIGNSDRGEHMVVWDVNKHPNLLIEGYTGSGKTVLVNTIIQHALLHPNVWEVYSIDNFNRLGKLTANSTHNSALTFNEVSALIDKIHREYEYRAKTPEKNHKHLLFCINELLHFTNKSAVTYFSAETISKLNDILCFASRYKVHLLVDTQRADLPSYIDGHFSLRVKTGISGSTVLKRGRGVIEYIDSPKEEFQIALYKV